MKNIKLFMILRIISVVISALLVAACVPVFIFFSDAVWGIMCIVAAVVFFLLTLLFKGLQEDAEKQNEPPKGDFIHGAPKDGDDKN